MEETGGKGPARRLRAGPFPPAHHSGSPFARVRGSGRSLIGRRHTPHRPSAAGRWSGQLNSSVIEMTPSTGDALLYAQSNFDAQAG